MNPKRRTTDAGDEPPGQRIIDAKLPLTWLISTAGGIIMALLAVSWNVSTQSSKLDQLITSSAKLEKRVDEKDVRIDAIRDSVFAAQRITDSHALRIEELERIVRRIQK